MAQRPKAPSAESEAPAHKPKMCKGFDVSTPAGRSAYKRSLPKPGAKADRELADRLRAEAAAKIAAGETEVRRGRPPGTGNARTLERRAEIQGAMAEVFASLTPEEIENIKPIDVFRLVTIGAVKANDHVLAMNAADKWAPYVHAKLAPIQVDTSNGVKRIVVENAPEGDDGED